MKTSVNQVFENKTECIQPVFTYKVDSYSTDVAICVSIILKKVITKTRKQLNEEISGFILASKGNEGIKSYWESEKETWLSNSWVANEK